MLADPEFQSADIYDVTGDYGKLSETAAGLRHAAGRLRPGMIGLNATDVDLVVGGPPCQGYSGIGHRRTFKALQKVDVPSNHLFHEMVKFIAALRPRMFLFENVRGLKSGRWTPAGEKGEIWRDVLAAFQSLEGYSVESAELLAKDYGVPQNRPRVMIVGIREDVANYPHEASSEAQRWYRTLRTGDIARAGDAVTEQEYSRHSERVRAKFAYMLGHGGMIRASDRTKKFAQRVLPRKWDSSGPSITATSLPDDYVHFEQPRVLTVREWARLQTFPDWYRFVGKRTTGGRRRAGDPARGDWTRELPKYTQIGNAVPVRLAQAIGSHFLSILAGLQNGAYARRHLDAK
jgi:DNA (cytosine-5)-methyltransferase 1